MAGDASRAPVRGEWRAGRRHLAFRDLLRVRADVAADYRVFKRRLAQLHDADTFASREAYSLPKRAFVEAAIERADTQRLPRPRAGG